MRMTVLLASALALSGCANEPPQPLYSPEERLRIQREHAERLAELQAREAARLREARRPRRGIRVGMTPEAVRTTLSPEFERYTSYVLVDGPKCDSFGSRGSHLTDADAVTVHVYYEDGVVDGIYEDVGRLGVPCMLS